MARRKKTSDTKTFTLWGIKYTFDPKSRKWMEGKKEASSLMSVMLDDLYAKFAKTNVSPQEAEETEIILSPLSEEEKDEVSENVKESAKLQKTEAEQKIKSEPTSEDFKIVKPTIEVDSLIKPEASSREASGEKRLPRLENILLKDKTEKEQQTSESRNVGQSKEAKREDQSAFNFFVEALKKIKDNPDDTTSVSSKALRDAIISLNKSLGSFTPKVQEQKISSADDKIEKIIEKNTGTEKSAAYLKSIDDKITEILSFIKSEEKEEDAQEVEAEANVAKEKLEESYKSVGAELSGSVNDAILGSEDSRSRKGLLDSRIGQQFNQNLARRLDEDLPILNLFTDKLQQMKEDPGSGIGGVTILGDAFGNIGKGIKKGAGAVYRAGAAGARGIGKVFRGAGSMLGGLATGGAVKSAGSMASGLLGKAGGVIKSAGSLMSSGARSIGKGLTSTFGKAVSLGSVGVSSAGSALASSAKATSSVAKGFGKSLLKKIPLVGAIAGLGFGAQRLFSGDLSGAALEVGSGLASTVPGLGTAASVGMDAALAAKDAGVFDSDQLETPASVDAEQVAEQQKPRVTNQTTALKEFESQRKLIQDKKTTATSSSPMIINNNKSDKSDSRGPMGIMTTAGATRSLYLYYYAA